MPRGLAQGVLGVGEDAGTVDEDALEAGWGRAKETEGIEQNCVWCCSDAVSSDGEESKGEGGEGEERMGLDHTGKRINAGLEWICDSLARIRPRDVAQFSIERGEQIPLDRIRLKKEEGHFGHSRIYTHTQKIDTTYPPHTCTFIWRRQQPKGPRKTEWRRRGLLTGSGRHAICKRFVCRLS